MYMTPDNDNVINAVDRFKSRRERKVINQLGEKAGMADIIPLVEPVELNTSIDDIKRIYDSVVQPVINILDIAGYADAAHRVSQICASMLLRNGTEEAVKAKAEGILKDTDPELFAYALNRSPNPEEE
jgi:hypothetical protein